MTKKASLWIGGALILTGAACASEPADSHASTEQPLEGACAHAICASGAPLQASCDPCAATLCASDPYCCYAAWDATCVGEVASLCGASCTAPPPAPTSGGGDATSCAHALCASGGQLDAACDPCATALCGADPYCCAVAWDATCVGEVAGVCGKKCQ
jgi:hypothetical protein